MAEREGPKRIVRLVCDGCVHLMTVRYEAMDESCSSDECRHPSSNPLFATVRGKTPVWCPVLKDEEDAIVESYDRGFVDGQEAERTAQAAGNGGGG